MRSTCPFVHGWLTLVSLCSMPFSRQTRSKMCVPGHRSLLRLVNWTPLSVRTIWMRHGTRATRLLEELRGLHLAVFGQQLRSRKTLRRDPRPRTGRACPLQCAAPQCRCENSQWGSRQTSSWRACLPPSPAGGRSRGAGSSGAGRSGSGLECWPAGQTGSRPAAKGCACERPRRLPPARG